MPESGRSPRIVARRIFGTDPFVFVLRATVAAFAVFNAIWLIIERRARPYDIDEAGYLNMALSDWRAFGTGGVVNWYHTINHQPVYAPLVPASSSLIFVLFGPHRTLGFVVQLAAYLVIGLLVIELGRPYGRLTMALGTLMASCTPVALMYARSYSFALPASAALMLAIFAQVKSRNFLRTRWSISWGVAVGLVVLSRTMTLAYVPGVVVAGLVPCVFAPSRRKWRNFAVGLVAGVATAGTWYARNLQSVIDYLTSIGYGNRAYEYGSERSIYSLHDWLRFLAETVDQYVFAGLGLALVIGLLSALVHAVLTGRTDGARSLARRLGDPGMPIVCAVVVIPGFMALMSTRNPGSAFVLPLLAPLALIAAWGISHVAHRLGGRLCRSRPTGSSHRRIAPVLTAFLVGGLVIPAGVITYLPIDAHILVIPALPGWPEDHVTLFDSRGTLEAYADAGLQSATPAQRAVATAGEGEWFNIANQLADLASSRANSSSRRSGIVFGFRHYFLNPNLVALAASLINRPMPVWMPEPTKTNTVDDYLAQVQGFRAVTNLIVTASPGLDEFGPVITEAFGPALVAAWDATLIDEIPLPDGRTAEVWGFPAPA